MEEVMNDPRYRGFHVVVAGGEVFTAKTGERASQLLTEAQKKYPKEIPEITYLPDADTLIFRNEIPPLMGRHLFLETFETLFSSDHTVSFSTKK